MTLQDSPKIKLLLNMPIQYSIRKIIIVLLLGGSALLANAQFDKRLLRLSFNNDRIDSALNQLEKAANIKLFYTIEVVSNFRTARIGPSEKSTADWLTWILSGLPLITKKSHGSLIILPRQEIDSLREIEGVITDTLGHPLDGANISIHSKGIRAISDRNGNFRFRYATGNDRIRVDLLGFQPTYISLSSAIRYKIVLNPALPDVLGNVLVNTGYEQFKRSARPGSIEHVDNELFNRSVATRIMDHLDGTISSIDFVRNVPVGSDANRASVTIRGSSTINSSTTVPIVMDNFIFDGNLDNINVHDVESISILRDAAAANIWGSSSGNGVIVITTKKGRLQQQPRVNLVSNLTIFNRPDLSVLDIISPGQYVETESMLFGHNFYDYSSNTSSYLSPAVEILISAKEKRISSIDSAEQMNRLIGSHLIKELERYYYRPGFNQQYAVSVNGGQKHNKYYFSTGLDRNMLSLKRNTFQRITIYLNDELTLLDNRLKIYGSVYFGQRISTTPNDGGPLLQPYGRLKSENGVFEVYPIDYRQAFKNNLPSGLKDWNYRPLEELELASNTLRSNELKANIAVEFLAQKRVTLSLSYQIGYSNNDLRIYHDKQQYYSRNIYNLFTIADPGGSLTPQLPDGTIADQGTSRYISNNLRLSTGYKKTFGGVHSISLLGGYDLRTIEERDTSFRKYGYDRNTGSGKDFPAILMKDYFGGLSAMESINGHLNNDNNYLSYYAMLNYIFDKRISFLFSFRKDESNLFGSGFNSKGAWLWATGIQWEVSKENFFPSSWFDHLRFKLTTGYCGNVNTSISAFNTIVLADAPNRFGTINGSLVNPANTKLGWERVGIDNLGIEYSLLKGFLSGSFEIYRKRASDLIGKTMTDPTNGVSEFTGNSAAIETKGCDLSIGINYKLRKIHASTTILMSTNYDMVTRYGAKTGSNSEYMQQGSLHPKVGYPLYSVWSFPMLGLNSEGNAVGVLSGRPTTAYSDILGSTSPEDIRFSGPMNPTCFGTIRQTFAIPRLTFSFMLGFKFGNVFRRKSIDYYALYNGTSLGSSDLDKRWQKPGDEAYTKVPAMSYPSPVERDAFYNFSDQLIQPSDHIRLKDIRITYQFPSTEPNAPIWKVYLYMNNLGILWRANRYGIDPDFVPYGNERILLQPFSLAMGLNINF